MRSSRFLSVFVFLPFAFIIGALAANRVPAPWRNLYWLAVTVVVLGIVFGVPARIVAQEQRRKGLVPRTGGFSGKLEIAAEKLREAANELEDDPDAVCDLVLQQYVNELRRVAKNQDKHELHVAFHDPAALRRTAQELQMYAQTVRARGGIFKLDFSQRLAGAAIVIAGFAWGVWIVWSTWSTADPEFITGAALIFGSCAVGYALIKSQQDSDATRR